MNQRSQIRPLTIFSYIKRCQPFKQLAGCTLNELRSRLNNLEVFQAIPEQTQTQIIRELLERDLLELLGNELIIGVEGEKIINSKDFYTVFIATPSYKVVHQDRSIGEIPLLSIIQVDGNILLAARIWKVVDIDTKAKKISVLPAKDGRKPKFFGAGGDIHPRIWEKMLEMLLIPQEYPELNEAAMEILRQLRADFRHYPIQDLRYDRPLQEKEGEVKWFTFQGSKVNRSIAFLFSLTGVEIPYLDFDSSFNCKTTTAEFQQLISKASAYMSQIDEHLPHKLEANPGLIDFSKWGRYLPFQLQCALLKDEFYDFESTKHFLNNLRLMTAN